jgi:hypothetical protein
MGACFDRPTRLHDQWSIELFIDRQAVHPVNPSFPNPTVIDQAENRCPLGGSMRRLGLVAAPISDSRLVYVSVTGTWTLSVLGLWLLNTLFFSSSIFTVKLRKPRTASLVPGLIYHAIATGIIVGLWFIGWLAPLTAIGFGVALLKLGLVLIGQDWYRTTPIQNVAILETTSALIFLLIVALSLLPAHLS